MGKFEKVPQKRGSGRVLITILSVIFVLLMAVTGGAVYILMNYHIVGTKLYAKDLQVLDLREEDLTVRNYKKLQEKMPGTRIRWEIPFQGDHLADDAEEITITNLSAGDIEILEYARQLKLVQAEGCTDYENLQLLRQHRPELKITYSIALSAGSFSWDIDTLVLDRVEESDISLLFNKLSRLDLLVLYCSSKSFNSPKSLILSSFARFNSISLFSKELL